MNKTSIRLLLLALLLCTITAIKTEDFVPGPPVINFIN